MLWYNAVLILHVLIAVIIVGLVLVQQGKGAGMGSSFGAGASQTVFGSRGAGSLLLKITVSFAVLFFTTSIILNNMAARAVRKQADVVLPNLPAIPKTAPSLPKEAPLVTPSSIPDNVTQPQNSKK